jgi:hypothetical protein
LPPGWPPVVGRVRCGSPGLGAVRSASPAISAPSSLD